MTMEGCWGKQNGKQSLANQHYAKIGENGGNGGNGQKVIPKMVDKKDPGHIPARGSDRAAAWGGTDGRRRRMMRGRGCGAGPVAVAPYLGGRG